MADFTIKSGSTTPALTVTLLDGAAPVDLTGATVRMRMRSDRGGDLVIDASLRDLAEAPDDDLDAQIERGEQVQRTLQGRLSDLGG